MPPTQPPILRLDDVAHAAQDATSDVNLCHAFGILKSKETANTGTHWLLRDETSPFGIKIKLCGNLAEYPDAEPGDIVRIHRLTFDRNLRNPIVTTPRNVVVWAVLRHNPDPIKFFQAIANSPTIQKSDVERIHSLETFYYSLMTSFAELKQGGNGKYHDVISMNVSKKRDQYGNIELGLRDANGDMGTLRCFLKKLPTDIAEFYSFADTIKAGEIFVVSHAKYDLKNNRLDLSSNLNDGRFLRIVDRGCAVGKLFLERLAERTSRRNLATDDVAPGQPVPSDNSVNLSSQPTRQLRRSPRLHTDSQNREATPLAASQDSPIKDIKVHLPPAHRTLADAKKIADGYTFVDLVGQVRGSPTETRKYGNLVVQLYDGTSVDYASFFKDEVQHPEENCAVILIYKPQLPWDTPIHYNTALEIHSGDLVQFTNVKASWCNKALKLEMSANLSHGKSLLIIPPESQYGLILSRMITNPIFEEHHEIDVESEDP